MMQRPFLLAAALVLAGCPKSMGTPPPDGGPVPTPPPPSTAQPTASATAPAPAPTASGATSSWVGEWRSPSCGERKYARWLTLAADGKFSAQDRVSPCPPNVQCVWSGIVNYSGSWSVTDGTLTLDRSDTGTPPKTVTLLTTLSWSDSDNAPKEGDCLYATAVADNPSK